MALTCPNSTGGGSSLSRKEREEIHAEVDAEFESEEQAQKWGKRKKLHRRGQETSSDLGSLFDQSLTGKLPKYVNKITLKVYMLEKYQRQRSGIEKIS